MVGQVKGLTGVAGVSGTDVYQIPDGCTAQSWLAGRASLRAVKDMVGQQIAFLVLMLC